VKEANMNLRQIDLSNKKDVRRFIDFPFELYCEDPLWVPPLLGEMRAALNPAKHPFYQHSEAAFFIAEQDGRTLGRIAAIDNEHFKRYTQSKTGFFYFFETVEDIEVAHTLFEAVFDWSRQRGLPRIFGPKGLAQGDGMGLLVEGYDRQPGMGIPYNPPYYEAFIKEIGFEKHSDYVSGYLNAEYQLPERVFELAERVKQRRGFWVKQLKSKAEMREWIPQIRQVYNTAFVDIPGFVPLTEDEVQMIANRIISVADPRLIKLVFKGEEMIGFLFAYHNISAGLRKARGRMWPLGWLHILREFKRTKWVDFNGIGLLPQHQGVGATAVLFTELEKSVREFDFEHADLVQVNETNIKSFVQFETMGVQIVKRHRLYQKEI
jgi:hypothetical protein